MRCTLDRHLAPGRTRGRSLLGLLLASLIVAVGIGGLAMVLGLGEDAGTGRSATVVAAPPGEETPAEDPPAAREPVRGLRAPAGSDSKSPEPRPAAVDEARAAPSQPEEAGTAPAGAFESPEDGLLDRLALLRRDQDDETRLEAAREILAGDLQGAATIRALNVLAELDPESVAGELVRLATEAGDDPRANAALLGAIQMIGSRPDVLDAADLRALYATGSNPVQLSAASALMARGDESLALQFQNECADHLASEDPTQRTKALRDLGTLGKPESLGLVVPLLDDGSRDVRLAALEAVREIDGVGSIELIRGMTNDPDDLVRRTATRTVQMLDRIAERTNRR